MAVTNRFASTRMVLGDTADAFTVTTPGDALVLKLSSQKIGSGPSQVSMAVIDAAGRKLGKVLCQDGADRRLSIEDVANSPFTVLVECNQGEVLAQVDQLTDLDSVLPEGDASLETAAVPDLSITTAKLNDLAVTTGKIAAGALAASAPGRAKIADDFFTNAEMVAGAGGKFAPASFDATACANVFVDGALPSGKVSGSIPSITTAVTDPGNAGAIPATGSGRVALVSGGAETRTLAAPASAGLMLLIYSKTMVGAVVLTVATTIQESGNNTVTFTNTGEMLTLVSVEEGSAFRWRVLGSDGCVISTV